MAIFYCLAIASLVAGTHAQEAVLNVQDQGKQVAWQMQDMMTDPNFQEEAKIAAKTMQTAVFDPEFQGKFQGQVERISEQIKEVMAEPKFQEEMKRFAEQVQEVMGDPRIKAELKRFAEQMKTVVAELNSPNETEHSAQHRNLFAVNPPAGAGASPRAAIASQPAARVAKDAVSMGPTLKVWKAEGVSGPELFEVREVADAKAPVRLLSKLEQLQFATTLSELGLLSAAEKAGLFSALEQRGAFSTAEKLLPVVDKLGLLQLMQNTLDVEAGLLFTAANWLIALGPIYVSLAICNFAPIPEGPLLLLPGALFTGTTGAGVLLWAWAYAVGKLQEQ